MSLPAKCAILLLSIAAAVAADKKDPRFAPGPASSYPNRETTGGLTLAALAMETAEQARPAFGKLNPYEHGLLPVLLILQNDSGQALNLEQLRVEYNPPDGRRIEATPAKDVPYLHGPDRPSTGPRTNPLPRRKKKNPLEAFEIEGRAFAVRMLPRGEAAHGFFYFQTKHRSGAKLYVTGIREAGSGKELFYIEINLDTPAR